MTMLEILESFACESFFDASGKLLKHLGVKCSTQTEEPIPFLELYEDAAKDAGAEVPKPIKKVFARVDKTYFIGTVDDDTLGGKNEKVDFAAVAGKPKYEGMFVFAVQMKEGETLTRSEAAVIVRGINRVVKQMPATVLILEKHHAPTEARRHGEEDDLFDSVTPCEICLSVATCERTEYRQSWRPGERLGKVSILKGVNTLSPHRGHIDILESMNVNDCATFDALYAQWQKVFSTSLLTNKFYNELFNWYVWAIDPKTDVYFPNDPDDDSDDFEGRETKIIRLITRAMFVWFIRQKKLVPDWIFDTDYLKRVLKDFDPTATDSGNYYNAVLQNLFFATLNRAIEDEDGKRRFAELQGHVDAKNLYRYDELYKISKDEIVDHFASIPFVNGSLFECLDKTKGNDGVGKAFYYDGFSRNDKKVPSTNHYRYRAFVPNNLFFDPELGLFSIFERYNFTIEENTPLEQQVALDPELLGKVFENLLGVYNPETKETARKQSGSFYTPREIVDYMVDETLISYLGDTKLVRDLFSESFTYNELDWSEYQAIAAKLKTVKILDPACGSGAFPVGMLNRIVEILGKLKTDRGDVFKLKRHIIENCIYGSDIQCIAAQITKLRFFISLIVNCERDESKKNFGIPELPNLETKFVAANSLIGLEKIEKGQDLFENPKVVDIAEELRRVRHDHFNANTAARKRRLVKKDAELRKQLFEELNGNFFQQKGADLVAKWNPYDQNTSSEFFDPEWMFGIKDGFDIVIGNPPYVKLETIKDQSRLLETQGYEVFTKRGDLYCLFTERGFQLLKKGGTFSYIMSNKWLQAEYGRPLRKYFLQHELKSLIDFGDNDLFKGATVYPCIFVARKAQPAAEMDCVYMKYYDRFTFIQDIANWRSKFSIAKLTDDTWMLSGDSSAVMQRVMTNSIPLGEYIKGAAVRGVTCGATAAFILDSETSHAIMDADNTSRTIMHPVLRGRDVHPWVSVHTGYYLIGTFPARHLSIDDYPAIKQHLLDYGRTKLEQTGAKGSRKKTGNAWFETQDQIGYYKTFALPKIMYQKFQVKPCFFYDESGLFCNDSMWMIPTSDKALVGVLNSKIGWWLISKFCTQIQNGYQLIWEYFSKIPVPKVLPPELSTFVEEILAAKKENPSADVSALEEKIDNLVFDLYGLTPEEREIVKGGVK